MSSFFGGTETVAILLTRGPPIKSMHSTHYSHPCSSYPLCTRCCYWLPSFKMTPALRVNGMPDLSASVKAKVAASIEEQLDPAKMQEVYDGMASRFEADGLDLPAIKSHSVYFTNVDESDERAPKPLQYVHFPGLPLPTGSVRLSVLYCDDPSKNLPYYNAAQTIAKLLPAGCKVYLNKPEHYHVTVFMTSQPHDLRPNPYAEQGDWHGDNPVPSLDIQEKEFADVEQLAAAFAQPDLEVYRLVLTNTGTLLLCCTDRTGVVARLRASFQQQFPGAAARQSTILHISLFRILTPSALTDDTRSKIQAQLEQCSQQLRGSKFKADKLWHVHEDTFTTVEGPRRAFPLLG